MKLAPDAQAELDRHAQQGGGLHALIRKAGKCCERWAVIEREAVDAGDLHLAAYFADAQERWSALAFDAAKMIAHADQRANFAAFGKAGG